MAFTFKIIDKCYQDAKRHVGTDADFYLELDAWNDNHYHVMYHLHATKKITGDNNEYLGPIRIMKVGQTHEDIYTLHKEFGYTPFTRLPKGYASLTFSMDVFRGLNRYVSDPAGREEIVDNLALILSEESPAYAMIEDEDCFKDALLRDGTLENFALKKAQMLLLSKECIYDLRKESFQLQLNDADEPVTFDFTCLDDSVFAREARKVRIPNGCIVFIGGNGSGKSTAMYKLAKLMYADTDERSKKEYKEYIGHLIPDNVGISKLIVVSYSPFDNFLMPAWQEDKETSEERLVYCGIRDYVKERDLILEEQDGKNEEQSEVILAVRQNRTILKPISELAWEFVEVFSLLKDDRAKNSLWEDIANLAEMLHPDLYLAMSKMAEETNGNNMVSAFKNLSTGNKYIFHMLATVISTIDEGSLILFDEPENHIHPPLLSFLLSAIRLVLYRYKSVVFISTHSPVIVQETFAKNVYIIRREGDKVTMRHPQIETYGANVGEITSEVFMLTSDHISYYRLFNDLYQEWNMGASDSVDEMLGRFEELLGHRISEQLTAYLIDLWCQDHSEEGEEDDVDD